jgi:hypothetical protein
MRPCFKSCALLNDQNKHVHKDNVCSLLYSKLTGLLFSRITYTPQNRQALLVFFFFMFATKCWDIKTLSALWRAGALTVFFCELLRQTTLPYNKNKWKKHDREKEQTKWRFHSRPVWSIHMLGKPRTRGHPISDWLMTALLQATSERAFSIIDIYRALVIHTYIYIHHGEFG